MIVTARVEIWIIIRIQLLCLLRGKDNPEVARLNLEPIRELPHSQVFIIVSQVPAIQIDIGACRIINLNPVGRLAVPIQNLAFLQRLLAGVAGQKFADEQVQFTCMPIACQHGKIAHIDTINRIKLSLTTGDKTIWIQPLLCKNTQVPGINNVVSIQITCDVSIDIGRTGQKRRQ